MSATLRLPVGKKSKSVTGNAALVGVATLLAVAVYLAVYLGLVALVVWVVVLVLQHSGAIG